jgi:hypothetical protein
MSAAVCQLAGLAVDAREHILEHGLLQAEKFPGLPVELPQDAGLADGEQQLLRAGIHQHPLVHFVEIERFAGHMLVVPVQLAIVRIERQGGVGKSPRSPGFAPRLTRIHGLACATPQ